MTPWAVTHIVADFFRAPEWHAAVLGISFSLGWLANFTVLFPLPSWARWTSIIAPWLAFFSDVFLRHYNSGTVASGSIDVGMLTFIPFYPWALGIALIHYSRLAEDKRLSPVP